jgi:hypothetical protein
MAGIGHNQPPKGPGRRQKLSLADPEVTALLNQLRAMRISAISEANGAIAAMVRSHAASQRFTPSRLEKSPRDRQLLADTFSKAWPSAIAKRMAQMQAVNRKLSRILDGWRLRTAEELSKPPPPPGSRYGANFSTDDARWP